MRITRTISASLIALAVASPAVAQVTAPEGETSPDALQDILVVAQKRSENVQNVPIAITAVSADMATAKGLTDIQSIGNQSPNVTLRNTASFGGSGSILVSYIRGIGQNDFAFNVEPGVGVYIDGVYLARNIGANVDLLDLDRIEVLKGPQGTLFGRNTIGGALNIVTRDPGDEWKFEAEASTGSFDRIDFRGVVDAPLIPGVLESSFAISTKHRQGYQKRVPYTGDTANNPILLFATGGAFGGSANGNTDGANLFPVAGRESNGDRSGNQNQTAFRAKFVFTPSDRLKFRLIGDYLNIDEQAAPFSLLRVEQTQYVALYNACITGNQAAINAVGALGGGNAAAVCNSVRGNPGSIAGTQPALSTQAGLHLPYDNRYVYRDASGNFDPDFSYASGSNFSRAENVGVNFQIEYDLNDDTQLRSITAYRHLNSAFGVDIGGAPFAALNPTFADKENQLSQEVQLVGSFWDKRWKYVLGGYYFHEYGSHVDGVFFPAGLLQIYAADDRYDTKSYAAFIHNNVDVIPDVLGLTLGVRYTKENKQFTGGIRDENAFGVKFLNLPASGLPGGPTDIYRLYPIGLNKLSFNNVSFRVGAEVHPTRDVMIYASYASGFKGGGWTTRAGFPFVDFTPTGIVPSSAPTFGPEKAGSYEMGFKSTLLDRHLRINGALFQTDYKNIQLTFQNGITPVTANGGNGRIRGAELEVNSAFGGFNIDASLGYLETKFLSILPGVALVGFEEFVNSPKWKAQLGGSYKLDLGNGGSITPRLDWYHQSRSFNDEANTVDLVTQAHSIFNGSLRYVFPDENLELQLGVTNIFDKRVAQSGYTNGQAIYAATFNRPREWFLTFRVRN
jgi:iron complex outermembrane receptor protein